MLTLDSLEHLPAQQDDRINEAPQVAIDALCTERAIITDAVSTIDGAGAEIHHARTTSQVDLREEPQNVKKSSFTCTWKIALSCTMQSTWVDKDLWKVPRVSK